MDNKTDWDKPGGDVKCAPFVVSVWEKYADAENPLLAVARDVCGGGRDVKFQLN